MFGTVLNLVGIVLGGLAGLWLPRPLTGRQQSWLKVALGVWLTWSGLSLTWKSLHGGFWLLCKQLLIVVLAMIIGRVCGLQLGLQKVSNQAGQFARARLEAAGASASRDRFHDGFLTATALFCVAPLTWLGAWQDGLNHNFQPLLLKGLMDGLATMSFIGQFGWSPLLAVLPLAAVQGGLSLSGARLEPFLSAHGLLDSVNATSGFLIFSVALIALGLRRVDLNNYLPALLFAPLLTWLWR